MKTIILLALVAVAIVSAAVIPEEEEEMIERRFLKDTIQSVLQEIQNAFQRLDDKIQEAFSKTKIKGVINLIKHKGEDVIKSITKVFKKSKGKKIPDALVHLFSKDNGKYLGHFLDKAGKEVGHFFSKEIKGISHIKIFKNEKIEDFFKNVYVKAKQVARVLLSNKQFDTLLHKAIDMIDSTFTEKLCAEGVGKLIEAVTKSPASGKVLEPVSEQVCKTALEYLKMGANIEIKIVEKEVGTSH